VHDTNERAPRDTGQGVAASADFAVNLETTAEAFGGAISVHRSRGHQTKKNLRSMVEGLVEALMHPGVLGGVQSERKSQVSATTR
jgi:hypothetical protein